jgi:L-seryl-tRNA(Ser) seleniumtransferase
LVFLLRELGVKPVINAAGTVTVLGGSVMTDEVMNAMMEGAKVYVDMNQLHAKAGAYIAKLLGAEMAYVTSGAAAGLVLAVGACMTRGRRELMRKLPRAHFMRNEVIVQKLHRNMYDHNLEIAGATIKQIGNGKRTTRRELKRAINRKTAAIVYFHFDPQEGVLPLEDVIEIAHRKRVPVIVDAAAEIPPKNNLARFLRMGADLVLFSGGKDIGAPNDTGMILGKRELVTVCERLGPHSYERVGSKTLLYIGRPMKTSKEDVLALVEALKRYLTADHQRRMKEWETKARYMADVLSKVRNVKVARVYPGVGHNRPVCIPRVELAFPEGPAAEGLLAELRELHPPIYAYVMNNRLYLNPQCLRDGEEVVVAESITRLLAKHV